MARISLLVLITTAALFGAYELAERTWLLGADARLRWALHIARGTAAALISAAIASWLVLKAFRPLLLDAPGGNGWPGRLGWTDKERIEHYSRWFIRMRWLAALAALAVSFTAVEVAGILPTDVWGPLVAAIAGLAAFNLLLTVLARKGTFSRRLLLAQVHFDLVVLTILLHFSGGIENPFLLLAFIHVVISGILTGRRECHGIAAVASALLISLAWAESTGVLAHYSLHVPSSGGQETLLSSDRTLKAASWAVVPCALFFLAAYFVTTISERARSGERRLEAMADRAVAERRLLQKALETTLAGLRVVGEDLQDRMASRRWVEWFGFGESPGKRGEDLAARATLADGVVRTTEIVLEDLCGNERPSRPFPPRGRILQVTTAPLPDAAGAFTQAVQLAQDVTEQKRAHLQVMQAGRLAAVGELAGHVAHEVNNPLSIISGKARLLLSDHRDEMSEGVSREIEKIVHCSDRVARIAQGLLSYCRPTGSRRLRLDIRAPIRKAKSMIDERARTAGIEIEERLGSALPPIHANAGEMEQVFLNLFLNALDAMPEGGRLVVTGSPNGKSLPGGRPCVTVTVEDTGIGIPAEHRHRIFEPFFSTKSEGKGTGLGLSICHGLVKGHGGEMHVESEPGKGSLFAIRLPAAVSEVAEVLHG